MSSEMKETSGFLPVSIPKTWDFTMVRFLFDISRGRVISALDLVDDGKYPVYSSQTQNNGCFGYIDTYDYEGEKITWTTDGANAGSVFYRNGRFNCTNVCGILTPKLTRQDNIHFLAYALNFFAFYYKRYDINGYKIMSNEMARIPLPLPSKPEQFLIVNILNIKVAQIERLIAIQEQQIEKLKEYKQSVISKAVTRGLDPNVPMKDSGIEWVGEIPTRWQIVRIKHVVNVVTGATPKSDNVLFWDGDIRWITPADIKTEDKYIGGGKRNISSLGLQSCSSSLLPIGSIVFSKRAPIGLTAITTNELCTNQGCLGCIPRSMNALDYYYYIFTTFTKEFEMYGAGTTFLEISMNNFSNFKIPYPSELEQIEIIKYLDRMLESINNLFAMRLKKIEILQEYKKSLIYEYVTGKRQVG